MKSDRARYLLPTLLFALSSIQLACSDEDPDPDSVEGGGAAGQSPEPASGDDAASEGGASGGAGTSTDDNGPGGAGNSSGGADSDAEASGGSGTGGQGTGGGSAEDPAHLKVWDDSELPGLVRTGVGFAGIRVNVGRQSWSEGTRIGAAIYNQYVPENMMVWDEKWKLYDAPGGTGFDESLGTRSGGYYMRQRHNPPIGDSVEEIYGVSWPDADGQVQSEIGALTGITFSDAMVPLGDDGLLMIGEKANTEEAAIRIFWHNAGDESGKTKDIVVPALGSHAARRNATTAWVVHRTGEEVDNSWAVQVADPTAESFLTLQQTIECDGLPQFVSSATDSVGLRCGAVFWFPTEAGGFGSPQNLGEDLFVYADALLDDSHILAVLWESGGLSFFLVGAEGSKKELDVGPWASPGEGEYKLLWPKVLPRSATEGEVFFVAEDSSTTKRQLLMLHFDLERGGVLGAPRILAPVYAAPIGYGRLPDGRTHVTFEDSYYPSDTHVYVNIVDETQQTELELFP